MRRILGIIVSFILFAPSLTSAQLSQYSWQAVPMQSGEVSNISVSLSNPDVMYLGVEVNAHSAYKSTDRGKTWKRIHTYDHNKDILVHPKDPNVVLLADSQQVWRSDTGGEGNERTGEGAHGGPRESFSPVLKNNNNPGPSASSFSTLAYAPSNPSTWYTAVRGSKDGGGGYSDGKPHLWKSVDAGKTWQEVAGKLPSTILVIHVAAGDENRLLFGSEDGVYESTDGGLTHTRLARADYVTSFTVVTTPEMRATLAASMDGILRSEDNGKTWETITQGLPSKTVLRVQASATQPLAVWATTLEGVAKSTDGGQTWQDASGNLPAKNLQALAVDPTNPDLAIVSTETFVFSVRSETRLFKQGQYYKQGVYRTEDGGKTWSRSDNGLIEDNVLDVTAHPSRPNEVWASQQSSRGLYRSRDAGQTWSLSPSLLTHYPMRTVFFPGQPDKLAHTSLHIGQDFGISDNSGVSWTTLSQETFFKALDRGVSLFDSSKKNGANFHLHGLAIDPKDTKQIYVGSVDDPSTMNEKAVKGAHVFKSHDEGKTWKESDDGYDHEYATSINDIKVDPVTTSTVYIAMTKKESTNGNGVWKSVDSGKTWQRANTGMPDNASVSTLVIHPTKTNQLLAATFEGLYRSTDSGATWTRKKSGVFKDIEFDPSNPEVVYTGSGPEGSSREGKNGIFLSKDFGDTWADITGNLPSSKVTAVSVSANGKIVYAGTEEKGLFMAIDPSYSVAQDTTTKTEISNNNQRGSEGEYSRGHDDSERRGGFRPGTEPSAWVKAIIMTLVALVIGTVVWLIIRAIKKRKTDV